MSVLSRPGRLSPRLKQPENRTHGGRSEIDHQIAGEQPIANRRARHRGNNANSGCEIP